MALGRSITLAPKLSTGTGRFTPGGTFENSRRVYVRFEVTAVGGTPTMTFTIQGSNDGGTTWTSLSYLTPDATVAAATTALTKTGVGVTELFLDGLDKRYFDQLSINVSANTNVTFNCVAQGDDRSS